MNLLAVLDEIRTSIMCIVLAAFLLTVGLTWVWYAGVGTQADTCSGCCIRTSVNPAGTSFAGPLAVHRYEFDRFTLQESMDENEIKKIELRYEGETLLTDWASSSFSTEVGCMRDYPDNGDVTYWYHVYSGGAHCCTTYVTVVVSHGRRIMTQLDYGDYMPPEGGWLSTLNGSRIIIAQETDFSYYQMPHNSLCFACSPSPSRVLVWSPSGWRVDRPGEFAPYYMQQLDEIKKRTSGEEHEPATIITMVYYKYMLGMTRDDVREFVRTNISKEYAMDTDFIVDDVWEKVLVFSPGNNQELD